MEVGLDGIFRFAEGGSALPPATITTTTPARGDAPPAPVTAASSDVFHDSPYAAYNDYSKEIILRRVQSKLDATGYYQGTIDGKAGPALRQALADFKDTFSLSGNGLLDADTLRSLKLDGLKEQSALTKARAASDDSDPQPKPKPSQTAPKPRPATPLSTPAPIVKPPAVPVDDLDAKFRRAAEQFERKN